MTSEVINTIRKTATERLEQITEYCSYTEYPPYLHDLFYLYSLIVSRDPARYCDQFGYTEIDLDNVIAAKAYFKYPAVSEFEKGCIAMLNDYQTKRDRESKLLPMNYTGGKNYGMANKS